MHNHSRTTTHIHPPLTPWCVQGSQYRCMCLWRGAEGGWGNLNKAMCLANETHCIPHSLIRKDGLLSEAELPIHLGLYHDFTLCICQGENTENPCHNKTREARFKQSVVTAGSAACQKAKPLIQTSVRKWYRPLVSCRFQRILSPFLKSVRQHNIVMVLRCVLCSETGDVN